MNDLAELLGILLLLGLIFLVAAAFFAAPGFLVLAIAGYEPIGFWNSAAAGLGSIVIGGILASIFGALRGR